MFRSFNYVAPVALYTAPTRTRRRSLTPFTSVSSSETISEAATAAVKLEIIMTATEGGNRNFS